MPNQSALSWTRGLRAYVPALILFAGCLLTISARRQHAIKLVAPLRTIPIVLAGFNGDEQTISENEQQVAGMSDYIFRVFRENEASAFSVYVGYYESQTTGRTIHSPKNCLPGAGWQSVETGSRTISSGTGEVKVNRVLLANGSMQALVYYWYQGRGRVAASEYRVKWDLLRDAATTGRTEEALVRIMVPISPSRNAAAGEWAGRQRDADALAERVARDLIPSVNRALPTWARPTA